MVWLLVILLATAAFGACEPPATPPAFVVRDSAGVEVVESYAPAWSQGQGWAVGAEATLEIGTVEGDPAHVLSSVVGALRLEDGTVVVADGGFNEVRFFDSTGSVIGTVGGDGEGPGEFTGLTGIGRGPSGEVWAYDFMLRRITWMESPGRMTRMTSLGPEPPMLSAVGAMADGSFVLKQLWGARQVAEATQSGIRRDPVAYVRVGSTGTVRDTVVLTPGRELVLTDENGRGVMGTPPFGRNSVGAVRRASVVVGSQDRLELDEYGEDGALIRRMRIPDRDLTLRPEEVQALIEERLAELPVERRPGARRSLESVPRPARRPAYGGVLVDALDHVWLSEWAMLPRIAMEWTVLAPDGRWLGTVEVPERFEVLDIGAEWIVGLRLDDLDVQSVVVYPLSRSGT